MYSTFWSTQLKSATDWSWTPLEASIFKGKVAKWRHLQRSQLYVWKSWVVKQVMQTCNQPYDPELGTYLQRQHCKKSRQQIPSLVC
jgi:hypothetical protein